MATEWISPTWRMPNDKNQSKFENYSLSFPGINTNQFRLPSTWITDLGLSGATKALVFLQVYLILNFLHLYFLNLTVL
jgi:hypothetical protein